MSTPHSYTQKLRVVRLRSESLISRSLAHLGGFEAHHNTVKPTAEPLKDSRTVNGLVAFNNNTNQQINKISIFIDFYN